MLQEIVWLYKKIYSLRPTEYEQLSFVLNNRLSFNVDVGAQKRPSFVVSRLTKPLLHEQKQGMLHHSWKQCS